MATGGTSEKPSRFKLHPEITIRVTADVVEHIKANSASLGITFSEYVRQVLTRDAVPDPDERFIVHLAAWWGYRGQGDPAMIQGARARAAGNSLSFAAKLRSGIRTLLDHSLI